MATETLYNYDPVTPAQLTREEYQNVGSSDFQLGDAARGFKGGTDFEIWDAATGGTQLVENTDYELKNIDNRLSGKAGFDIYTRVNIITPAYQTGNIYITYKAVLSYVDAVFYNNLYNIAIAAEGSNIKYLTNADSPYTIADGDGFGKYVCDTSGGDITINLPTLADNQNRELSFIHQTGGGLLTIDGESSETIDGLTTIELPKQYDRMTILGTTSEWEMLEERISCQLRLQGYAGYGSTDNKIMRFTNSLDNYGNMFEENHSTGYNGNTEGIEITINRSGVYSFNFTVQTAASIASPGLSINSSQLTTGINSITPADVLEFGIDPIATNASFKGWFNKNDVIRAHTQGQAGNASYCYFNATYGGN